MLSRLVVACGVSGKSSGAWCAVLILHKLSAYQQPSSKEQTYRPMINATILIHRSYSSAFGSLRAYFALVSIASYMSSKGCAAGGQAGCVVIWRMAYGG